MLRAKTDWRPVAVDSSAAEQLVLQLGITPLLAKLLLARGIDDPLTAARFLRPELSHLHDPYLLAGMKEAVIRLKQAIASRERILIYGDYDADGVSSTTLMYLLLQGLEADVGYYIPDRFSEGYGLNEGALRQAQMQGYNLVITVDTGISGVAEAECARALGLDLIVTDHHEPKEVIPAALAVINPKLPYCQYPFKGLAGVGVAFKLATALLGEPPVHLLPLVALGTVADLVPLRDENRVLVYHGLKYINSSYQGGLLQLVQASGITGPVTAEDIAFQLGPRINAAGRLERAEQVVQLLTADDPDHALQIAQHLDHLNQQRQQLVEETTQAAVAQIEAAPSRYQHFIVVAGPMWNAGIVGIVASRLVEKYYLPTLVLSIQEDGLAKGSARSIAGFDVNAALVACQSLLVRFGGHPMAAGLTVRTELLEDLHQQLSAIAEQTLTPTLRHQSSPVDAEFSLAEVDIALIQQLDSLAPYGCGNPVPAVEVSGCRVGQVRQVGINKDHLMLRLDTGINVIGFKKGELAPHITVEAEPRLLCELTIDEWNGVRRPRLLLRDLAVEHVQIFDWRSNRLQGEITPFVSRDDCCFIGSAPGGPYRHSLGWLDEGCIEGIKYLFILTPPPSMPIMYRVLERFTAIERLYLLFGDREYSSAMLRVPARESFAFIYKLIMRDQTKPLARNIPLWSRQTGMSQAEIKFILQVFVQLHFITILGDKCILNGAATHRSLTDSPLYRQHQERAEVLSSMIYSTTREINLVFGRANNEFKRDHQGDPRLSASGHQV